MTLYKKSGQGALQKGFTIVELLIVVIVIAILATITIVSFNNITSRANDSAVLATQDQLKKKLEIKKIETDSPYVVMRSSSGATPATIADFVSFNGLTGLEDQLCLSFSVNNNMTGVHAADSDSSCTPSLVEGQVPTYDKKKLYVSANQSLYIGNGYDDMISNATWSNERGAWLVQTVTKGSGAPESRSESVNRCAPFLQDYLFDDQCRYREPEPL